MQTIKVEVVVSMSDEYVDKFVEEVKGCDLDIGYLFHEDIAKIPDRYSADSLVITKCL